MADARHLVLADGRILSYAEYGASDGRPLVFLHGFPGSRYAGALVDRAAREAGVRVLAPERPGIGRSSPCPGRTLLDYARDVDELADRLGLDRFGLVGESGGGPYTLACAFALAERVTHAAVLAGLGPVGSASATDGMARGEQVGYALACRAPRFSGHALALIARWGKRHPSAFLRLCASQFAEPDRRALERAEVAAVFVRDFLEAFRQGSGCVGEELALLMRPWPFAPAAVRVPLDFFHGELDRTVPVGVSRELASVVRGARLHLFADEGHLSILLRRAPLILAASAPAPRHAASA